MRRFWRGVLIFLTGGILGTAFGLALGLLIFPFMFAPPPATEQLTEADRTPPDRRRHVHPCQSVRPVHWGKGTVSVSQRQRVLEDDFEVGPGPKFHVYLVPKAQHPRQLGRAGHDVRRSRPAALVPGQPALRHPGRRRPEEVSERRHLVRAVQRADLAGRPHSGPTLDGFRRRFCGHLAAAARAGRGRGAVRQHSRRHCRLRHRRAAAAGSCSDGRRAAGGADHHHLGVVHQCEPAARVSPLCRLAPCSDRAGRRDPDLRARRVGLYAS